MARLGRKGRILQWVGLVLSLLIGVAWVVSLPWAWTWVVASEPAIASVTIHGGCGIWDELRRDATLGARLSFPWRFFVEYRPAYPGWLPEVYHHAYVIEYALPLWIPFLFCAIPTALLWWLDRRRHIPLGHCQKCRYNLTGNVSRVCPECGEKA